MKNGMAASLQHTPKFDDCECGKPGFRHERHATTYMLNKRRQTEPVDVVECPVGSCFHVFNPTVRDKETYLKFLVETDAAAKHPDVFFLMYTNGTLINETVANRLAALGNVTPAISVEGWQERTDERRGAVADTILAEMPDVVGVQEATQGNLAGSTLNQYDDLLALLGDPYRVTNAYRYNCRTSTSSSDCSYVDRGASQSVRIIYNAETLKLLVGGSLKLAAVSSSDNPRYLAWAQFTQISTGKTFFFGTTHLQPNTGSTETYVKAYADLREKQARQIVAHLAEVAGAAPVIVTGDMNTRFNSPGPNGTTGNPQYAVFTGAGFHDPLNGGTAADREKGPVPSLTSLVKVQYNSCNSYSRTPPSGNGQGNNIDYIYLKGGITATGWETALDLDPDGDFDGVIPSDHNLIAAEVVLP